MRLLLLHWSQAPDLAKLGTQQKDDQMNIPLSQQQKDWLKAQVAAGRFASLEEAVASAVAGLQAQEAIDDNWAKPLIDEALEALDRGEGSEWRKGEVLEKIKAGRASGT